MVLSGQAIDDRPSQSLLTSAPPVTSHAYQQTNPSPLRQEHHGTDPRPHSQHDPSQQLLYQPPSSAYYSYQRPNAHPQDVYDDAALDEVLEAETLELEHLVQMHEAMSEDHQPSQTHADEMMDQTPSSPSMWGSDDGDDSFEGELWRLGDSVDGNAAGGDVHGHGDEMDMS